jgi:hypothetical protein
MVNGISRLSRDSLPVLKGMALKKHSSFSSVYSLPLRESLLLKYPCRSNKQFNGLLNTLRLTSKMEQQWRWSALNPRQRLFPLM